MQAPSQFGVKSKSFNINKTSQWETEQKGLIWLAVQKKKEKKKRLLKAKSNK